MLSIVKQVPKPLLLSTLTSARNSLPVLYRSVHKRSSDMQSKEQSAEAEYVNRSEREALRRMLDALNTASGMLYINNLYSNVIYMHVLTY